MKIKNSDTAISQILAASLLLLMALAILSMVYMYYLSYPLPDSPPYVDISGTVEGRTRYLTGLGTYEEYFYIILTHRGGESLPLGTKALINVANRSEDLTIGDHLESEYTEDGVWGIGEQMILQADNITNNQVDIIVYDSQSDHVVFRGSFQSESYLTTQGVFNLQDDGATLMMDFDFKEFGSGRVRFAYKQSDEETWSYTNWKSESGRDFYHKRVDGLPCNTNFDYKGEMEYDSTIEDGGTKSFRTLVCP